MIFLGVRATLDVFSQHLLVSKRKVVELSNSDCPSESAALRPGISLVMGPQTRLPRENKLTRSAGNSNRPRVG